MQGERVLSLCKIRMQREKNIFSLSKLECKDLNYIRGQKRGYPMHDQTRITKNKESKAEKEKKKPEEEREKRLRKRLRKSWRKSLRHSLRVWRVRQKLRKSLRKSKTHSMRCPLRMQFTTCTLRLFRAFRLPFENWKKTFSFFHLEFQKLLGKCEAPF